MRACQRDGSVRPIRLTLKVLLMENAVHGARETENRYP